MVDTQTSFLDNAGSASAGAPPPAPPDTSSLPVRSGQPVTISPQVQPPPHQTHTSFLSTLLHAVGDVFQGTPTQSVDPQTGQVRTNQLTTGQKIGNVVGAALRGAAVGAAATGPGAVGKAALLGIQEEQGRRQLQNQELNDTADRAIHALNTARAGWEFQRQKDILHENAVDKFNAIDSFVGSDERNQDLGTFPTFADFLQAHPEMQAGGTNPSQLAARGLIVNTIATDDKGQSQGVHVWQVSPDWLKGTTDGPFEFRQYQGNGEYKPAQITEGTKRGDILALLQNNGYGSLATAAKAAGPKSHADAVAMVANGNDADRIAGQRYLDTENKLAKNDALSKFENVPSTLARENAAAAIPQLQNMLATETDPDRKLRINRLIATARAAHQGYVADLRSDAAAKQAAAQGDPVAAGKMLADGSLTLADLKTRGMTPGFVLQASQAAQKINPQYKPSDEVIAEQVAKSPQANQFFGSANSLIQKGGTLDQLISIGATIPQNEIPILNTFEDWQKVKSGKGPLAGYAATILGVADDYGKVMGGGTASDSARDSALALIGR